MKKIVTLSLSLLLLTLVLTKLNRFQSNTQALPQLHPKRKIFLILKKLIAQVVSHQLYIIQVHKQMKQLKWN